VSGAAPVLMVTGASSGIGRAVALRAAPTGVHLVLVARDGAALADVAEECESLGAAGTSVESVDIGDDAAVAGAVRRTLEREGRLDAVVNSAGVVAYGALQAVPVDIFDGVLRTNLLGAANVARHVLPILRAQGRGHLVLVGSVLGHIAVPGMTAYIVSKWGVRALARQLVLENRDLSNVHVSCVSPGGVDTPIYEQAATYLGVRGRPPAPVISPERVAGAILRVLDRPRDRQQVGAANGLMRAGFTFLPGLYDALVGPLFGVAALDRSTSVAPGPGNVLAPAPDGHSLRGSQPGPLVAMGRNVATLVRGRRPR
jgi:short-subunit dehydrogenase